MFPICCSVIAVPKEGVSSMPTIKSLMRSPGYEPDVDFFVEAIVLKTGYSWLDITNDLQHDTELEETEDLSGQGKAFTYALPFRIPNDEFATRGKIIRAYDNREFIVVLKQRSGVYRVLGSLDRGCFFRAQLKTGKTRGPVNAYQCGFEWECAGLRAFYVKPFNAESYFDIIGTNVSEAMRLGIDESVLIVWNDGTSSFHMTGTGVEQPIYRIHTQENFSYRVYHRNKALGIDLRGDVVSNGSITEIAGESLPTTLIYLNLTGNLIETVTMNGWTGALTTLDFSVNVMNDAAIEGHLFELDELGGEDGTADFSSQTPAVVPTVDMLATKVLLEAKGWTITF